MGRPRLTGRFARLRERLPGDRVARDEDSALLWAAVAAVLTPDPDAILLIRRADRAGDPWSGHIALPGGRHEPGDQDLVATAVRETGEEVGFQLSASSFAGTLEDVIPRTPVLPPIAVRPFVFLLPATPLLVPNPEVASARWVPIDDLLRPGVHHPVHLELLGQSREVQAYQLEDGIVWGMTERILTNLIEHL
ncbi:MAG TPA: CoA pyrophosphatase [Gemmatimonadales bacterium]|nr:CoA pyrophosphatase [Gemmatimonadales bacterium]